MNSSVRLHIVVQFRKATKKIDAVIITLMTIALLLTSAPAIALDSKSESEAVPRSILNLDMCTLAYQLYHQSLCLPLDPWYDVMSRVGSSRRDNICKFTHEYAALLGSAAFNISSPNAGFYSGPNAARGWANSNTNLDPILTNYKQLDAKLPAFTRDGQIFIAVTAPGYITNNIKSIDVMRYRTKPTSFPYNDVERVQIRDFPSGGDHLIAFKRAIYL